MIRATREERMCPACLHTFTAGYGAKGKQQRACSAACAGHLRMGKRNGVYKTKRHVRSGAVADHGPCPCSHCARIQAADRSTLIAKVAAEHGVEVSAATRPLKKPSWAARHKAIRDGIRARSMVPTARRGG